MAKARYETHIKPRLDDIERWLRQGATHKEIADKLGISVSAYHAYRKAALEGEEKYAEMRDLFVRACEPADKKVECALHKRACGFWWDEQVFELRTDRRTGEEREVCVRRTRRYVPPDPTSVIFWLTNRKPKDWRSAKMAAAVEAEGAESGVVELAAVMDEPKPPKGAE